MRRDHPFSVAGSLLVMMMLIASCAPAPTQPPPTATPTVILLLPTATQIVVASPTVAPSATPLPPTETFTPIPSFTAVTGTPSADDPALRLGTPEDVDNFDDDDNWTTFPEGDNECFWSEISDGKFSITAEGRIGLSCWELSWPVVENFYLEFKVVMPETCAASEHANDRFGMVFRAPENDKAYLYGITCGGMQTFTAWTGEETLQIVAPQRSSLIQTAPGSVNRVGILAEGTAFSFYINGAKVAEATDDTFTDEGKFGFYVNAASEDGFTVAFDALSRWDLPQPTGTVTVTVTPTP